MRQRSPLSAPRSIYGSMHLPLKSENRLGVALGVPLGSQSSVCHQCKSVCA
jgi:hypothetical protein